MNRRRKFFIVLAVAVPIAVFIPAKIAASWRAISVQDLQMNAPRTISPFTVSGRYALCGAGAPWRVDLQTGDKEILSRDEGITAEGAWSWKIVPALSDMVQGTVKRGQLTMRDGDAAPITLDIPHISMSFADLRGVQILTFSPQFNRIEMVLGRRYYRWNVASHQLECDTMLPQLGGAPRALTANGETLVYAGTAAILRISTRTGQVAHVKPAGVWQDAQYISPHASYAVYGTDKGIQIVDLRTGRVLWAPSGVSIGRGLYLLFSPDETSVAFRAFNDTKWQLHDTTTGRALGNFPVMPHEQGRTFAPDSSAFYIVSDNILYRQRAR